MAAIDSVPAVLPRSARQALGSTTLALIAAALLTLAAACAPQARPAGGAESNGPRLTHNTYIAADGTVLPLTRWPAEDAQAVVVALHGFNDYRAAFSWSSPALSARGITVYAYDQRGFGETETAGWWAGEEAMAGDALALLRLLRARHGETPLYLLGHSMGAAVAVSALARLEGAESLLDGVILAAPAAWGWSELNFFYRAALWTTAHVAPGWRLSGAGLDRVASDNREALIELGRDPNVIKRSRVDAIYGLVDLMDSALAKAGELDVPGLGLYGAKDEIVPLDSIEALTQRLPEEHRTVRRYEDGWHLLLRDCQRERVIADIAEFVLRR